MATFVAHNTLDMSIRCGSPHDCFIFAVEAPNGVVSHRFLVQALKDQHAEDPTFHRRNVSSETSALEAGFLAELVRAASGRQQTRANMLPAKLALVIAHRRRQRTLGVQHSARAHGQVQGPAEGE